MQATLSKKARQNFGMTNEQMSFELCMLKPEYEVDATKIQKIVNTFTTKRLHCFFMGRNFKFHIDSSQCHMSPPKSVSMHRMMHTWTKQSFKIISEEFKDGWEAIVVMSQGLKKMPTPEMWPTITKHDFWLIQGQPNIMVARKFSSFLLGGSQQ